MDYITFLGLIAGFTTAISFLPQVTKTWNTRQAKDISLPTLIILCTGLLLWVVYGILSKNLPVTLANVMSFILAFSILIFKVKYKQK